MTLKTVPHVLPRMLQCCFAVKLLKCFVDLRIFLQNIVDWKLEGDANGCTQVQSK